jgi:hypothetical protein
MFENPPLCRKEKYFTSCLLPQIICGDKLERLHLFLQMLNVPHEFIRESYDAENLTFYTEYSLKESANWKEASEIESKDTPDLILLLKSNETNALFLLVIEAKMYNKTSAKKFREQLDNQKKIIRAIKAHNANIAKDHILHVGLLLRIPSGLVAPDGEKLITWKEIVELYTEEIPDNYFLKMLEHAETRTDLVSGRWATGMKGRTVHNNFSDKLTISDLLLKCEKEGDSIQIGVMGGLSALRKMTIGKIRSRKFKWDTVSGSIGKKNKSNWIPGGRFLAEAKKILPE